MYRYKGFKDVHDKTRQILIYQHYSLLFKRLPFRKAPCFVYAGISEKHWSNFRRPIIKHKTYVGVFTQKEEHTCYEIYILQSEIIFLYFSSKVIENNIDIIDQVEHV